MSWSTFTTTGPSPSIELTCRGPLRAAHRRYTVTATASTLPAGTFTGQDEDVQLIGFTTTIIASAEMSDETAYAITAALVESAESLRSSNASMASFDPETAWTDEATGGVELHPGAQQYFEENGYMDSASEDS